MAGLVIEKRLKGNEKDAVFRQLKERVDTLMDYAVVFIIASFVFVFWAGVSAGTVVMALVSSAFFVALLLYKRRKGMEILERMSGRKVVTVDVKVAGYVAPVELNLRRFFNSVVLSTLVYFTAGVLVGYFFSNPLPKAEYVSALSKYTPESLFLAVLKNNLIVLLVVFVVSLAVGLPEVSLLPVFTSSIKLGAVLQYGEPVELLGAYMLSHGIIELTGYMFAVFSGVGLYNLRKSGEKGAERFFLVALVLSVVLITVSAYVEGYYSLHRALRALGG